MTSNNSMAASLFLILATMVLLASGVARAEPADWEIDQEHFSIGFEADHIGFQKQLGLFLEGSGSFRYDPETHELSGGQVVIAAESVFTNHQRRDEHLRGRDFLNAGRHPEIVFDATGFSADASGMAGTLSGNLTMLDQTRPVDLEVTINKRERYPIGHRRETLGISATTTIARSDWGMDYGVANALVGDLVTLRFELEAVRQ